MVYKLIIKRLPFNVKVTGSGIDFPFQFEPQIYSQKVDHYAENDVIYRQLNFEWLKRLVLHIPTVENYYKKALRTLVEELGIAEIETYKELEIPDNEVETFITELKTVADEIGLELVNAK